MRGGQWRAALVGLKPRRGNCQLPTVRVRVYLTRHTGACACVRAQAATGFAMLCSRAEPCVFIGVFVCLCFCPYQPQREIFVHDLNATLPLYGNCTTPSGAPCEGPGVLAV